MGAILDGKGLSEKIIAQVALEVANLKAQGILPKLCVILVGENPASISYVNMKKKACERTGIESLVLKFNENIAQKSLLDEIARLNADKSVSGILVQLPLPKHIDTGAILEAIEAKKDVDGFCPYNVGRLFSNIAESGGNLSLDKHSADSLDLGRSQTSSLVSHPKSSENYESHTENPSVVLNAESKNDSSLRDSQRESRQSKTTSDSAEVSCDGFVGCAGKFERDKTNRLSSENFSNSRKDAQETIAQLPILAPATPLGIMELLNHYDIAVSGKNVAIIGASNIVGKPLSALMLNAGATISVCHILTKDISVFTKSADIVCVGVGKVNLITADMIKDGAIVIDIGINKVNGKIKGDVDFESVAKKASFITPVPGGVGPMTIAMLLKNTILCAVANSSCGNSSLDKHSADLANFECSQTPSLVSHSKFAKNYESHTENPSVVLNAKSAESTSKGQK